MAHKFDPKHIAKLDNPVRRQIMPPRETLEKCGLKKGDFFLDIGCGIGYFSFPASGIVGPEGKVFAVDTSAPMLTEFRKRIPEKKIENIESHISGEYDFGVPSGQISVALMANVLHEVDDKDRFVSAALLSLKSRGRLIIIEWQKKETMHGPPLEHRLDKDEVTAILERTGFINITSRPLGDDFYVLTGSRD